MLRLLFTFLIAIITVGCGPRYVDYFPYQDDGTCKPCVAILPVIDCSNAGLPWDVSEEFSSDIRYRMMDDGNLFLLSPNKLAKITTKLGDIDYFDRDLSFASEFNNCEFLVVLELIEHRLVPYVKGEITPLYPIHAHKCNSVLMMKVRVRVIDLRQDDPVVVLQEILCSNHMISRDGECVDYKSAPWGTDAFCRTPFGQAHKRLIKDLVERIECVTWKAR